MRNLPSSGDERLLRLLEVVAAAVFRPVAQNTETIDPDVAALAQVLQEVIGYLEDTEAYENGAGHGLEV